MRAVYVPTPAGPGDAAYLVVMTADTARGGTLTRYATAQSSSCSSMLLTPEHLRQLLRRWIAAVRARQGRLQIGD